ncbi:unnamed protein product [Natator depressus]
MLGAEAQLGLWEVTDLSHTGLGEGGGKGRGVRALTHHCLEGISVCGAGCAWLALHGAGRGLCCPGASGAGEKQAAGALWFHSLPGPERRHVQAGEGGSTQRGVPLPASPAGEVGERCSYRHMAEHTANEAIREGLFLKQLTYI